MTLVPKTRRMALAGSPILGVDVSHHNEELRWQNLKATGRLFAFIKATEGGDNQDNKFELNRDGAHSNGVICGAYHFFRPKTAVKLQIENFCSYVGAMRVGELPPVLDIEVPSDWKGVREEHLADWQAIVMEDRIQRVLQWLVAVEKRLGIRPLIYASPNFVRDILGNDPRLAPYLLWLANYNVDAPTVPAPWTVWTFWQHSEKGRIPEFADTNLDLNYFNGSLEQLKQLCFGARANATAASPWYKRCWLTRWIFA